jgi:hypothetical protein
MSKLPLNISFSQKLCLLTAVGAWFCAACFAEPITSFRTVVNNNDLVPGTEKNFNSYNQPSVNERGLVVFRARTRGGRPGSKPVSGIFTRDMWQPSSPIVAVALRGDQVPAPNNTGATFNEFPSIPRIDTRYHTIATRGQSQPVLEYQIGEEPGTGGPQTTRGGTSGIYTATSASLWTGMSGLGNVTDATFPANPDLSYLQVPGTTPGTKFDQFPGAPSLARGNTLVFKGNWAEAGVRRTGVYYRHVFADGGRSPVQLVADSRTDIPGYAGTTFGSTAPPSAAQNRIVFLGVDNEAAPTRGGIYLAELDAGKDPNAASPLATIVSIGQPVMSSAGAVFTQFKEALSFDGRHVGYWGAWGDSMRAVTVDCDSIENQMRRAFCFERDDGDTSGSGYPGDGLFTFDVPVNQGFFITDVSTLETRLVAETGADYLDFIYWNFSGKVPGAEDEEDGEPARWRSSSFMAIDGWNAAFKATPAFGEVALYLLFEDELSVIAQVGMDGSLLDPEAVDNSGQGLAISSVGIERDGYRRGQLAFSASMTDGASSMAGVYGSFTLASEAEIPALSDAALALLALLVLLLAWRQIAKAKNL